MLFGIKLVPKKLLIHFDILKCSRFFKIYNVFNLILQLYFVSAITNISYQFFFLKTLVKINHGL